MKTIKNFGAGNETRTRDPDLGKVVLYQLSYSRRESDLLSFTFSQKQTLPKTKLIKPCQITCNLMNLMTIYQKGDSTVSIMYQST